MLRKKWPRYNVSLDREGGGTHQKDGAARRFLLGVKKAVLGPRSMFTQRELSRYL